jgi:hypothetical protein
MSDDPPRERRQNFRRKEAHSLPVRFRRPDGDHWSDAVTRNIGVGGAFLETDATHPVGTPLVVEISFPPDDRRFDLTAVVRWLSADLGPKGLGLQFIGVDAAVHAQLLDYFSARGESS